jgi:hypothetical protein
VIHTAFDHDFAHFVANCEKDRRVIEALGTVLKGSDRPFAVRRRMCSTWRSSTPSSSTGSEGCPLSCRRRGGYFRPHDRGNRGSWAPRASFVAIRGRGAGAFWMVGDVCRPRHARLQRMDARAARVGTGRTGIDRRPAGDELCPARGGH